MVEDEGLVVGFASLRPYHPAATFRRTAVLTYFILPGYSGHGLGSRLFDLIVADANDMGVGSPASAASGAGNLTWCAAAAGR